MKKIIAMLLALIMVCSLATTAFADETTTQAPNINNNPGQPTYTVDTTATFTKSYEVKSGTAPAETFNFEVDTEYFTFVDQHEATDKTVEVAKRPTVTITDPEFSTDMTSSTTKYTANATVTIDNVDNTTPLGVYTYKINEVPGETAGVNYTATPIYLVVTVLRDEESQNHHVAAVHYTSNINSADKVGTTDNSYEAGQLTISKEITGNMADMTNKFDFEVTFTPETVEYDGEEVQTVFAEDTQITVAEGSTIKNKVLNDDGTITITFELGDGASVNLINIPYGTSYIVKETNLEGYTQTKAEGTDGTTEANGEGNTAVTGTIVAESDADEVEFENELKSNVDTGIALDSAPYILMLVVAMVGMVALVSKKRYEV